MPVGYKTNSTRDRNYSFKDNKLILGGEEQTYGPQNEPKKTPAEEFISNTQEKRANEGWKLENEDGTTTEVGVPAGQTPQQGPANDKGQINFSDDPKAAQQFLKDKGYKIGVDGKWGKGSQATLNKYYRDEGIVPPNAEALDGLLGDLGVNVNSYAGLSEKELKNHPRGNKFLTIDGKPVEFKTSEVSSGGEVTPALLKAAEEVLPGLKDLGLKVTGGNDAYHLSDQYYARRMKSDFKKGSGNWKKKRIGKHVPGYKGGEPSVEEIKKFKANVGKSQHTSGNNMDIQVKDPAAARKQFLAQGFKLVKGNPPKYVNPKTGVTILDEYAGKTGGGSGPHFHIEGDTSHKH